MNKIKGLSLFYRIVLLFTVLILMILFIILLFNSMNYQREKSLYTLKVISENQVLNKEIVYLSNNYTYGNAGIKRELRKTINKYQQNYYLLNEGGVIEEGKEIRLKELNSDYSDIFDTLNSLNSLFIENLNELLKNPSSIISITIKNRSIVILKTYKILYDLVLKNTIKKLKIFTVFQILCLIIVIASLLFLLLIFYTGIFKPLNRINNSIQKIQKGEISKNKLSVQDENSELGIVTNSINDLLKRLKKAIIFINEIGQSNFNSEFDSISNNDELGNSLLKIKETFLKNAEEENKRKEEDNQQNWINAGLNKFYDLLRHNNNDVNELGYKVIVALVKYLEANQGGFFVYNDPSDSKHYLELVGSIAYDRRKYKQKKILAGEGILGSCILEKDTIYLSNIPDDYMDTESGLGDANPGYLLIVPLKIEEDLFGVIEIASFNEFKKFEIEFVETLSENIAASLKSLKVNIQTAELLAQAQDQTEELHSQEEEMRQNMEELQATQEEATRKVSEMESLLNAFNIAGGTFEVDLDGYIIAFNDQMLTMLDTTEDQLKNRDHRKMIESNFEDDDGYDKMLEELLKGNIYRGEFKVVIHAGEIWLDISYTPVRNKQNEIYKFLACANNVTLRKIQSLEFQDNYELMQLQDKIYKDKINELETKNKELQDQAEIRKNEIEELKKKRDHIVIKEETKAKKPIEAKTDEHITGGSAKEQEPLQKEITRGKPKEDVSADKKPVSETDTQSQIKDIDISIGISSVDEQHKKLIGLINKLLEFIEESNTKPEIQEGLYDLGEYTRYHFSYEEKYFKEFKYKDSDNHMKEHQIFIKDVSKLQKDFDADKLKSPTETINSLKKWLIDHIISLDKDYIKLFKKKGVK